MSILLWLTTRFLFSTFHRCKQCYNAQSYTSVFVQVSLFLSIQINNPLCVSRKTLLLKSYQYSEIYQQFILWLCSLWLILKSLCWNKHILKISKVFTAKFRSLKQQEFTFFLMAIQLSQQNDSLCSPVFLCKL